MVIKHVYERERERELWELSTVWGWGARKHKSFGRKDPNACSQRQLNYSNFLCVYFIYLYSKFFQAGKDHPEG